MPMLTDVLRRSHGLVVLAGPGREALRRDAWEAMSRSLESVFFVGPLAEKPVLGGGAKLWLLEVPDADRSSGLREVLRRDPHGICLLNSFSGELLALALHASLSGSLCLLECDAPDVAGALDRLRPGGTEGLPLASALVAVATNAGEVWVVNDAARQALANGVPGAQVAALR